MSGSRRKKLMSAVPGTNAVPTDQIHTTLASIYDGEPRYMVALRHQSHNRAAPGPLDAPWVTTITNLHGHQHPTIFKTLRNAMAAAIESSAHVNKHAEPRGARQQGILLAFDPTRLPVIDLSAPASGLFREYTELEFAERQLEWWGKRVQALTQRDGIDNRAPKAAT